jgi:MoxR-like ATPase
VLCTGEAGIGKTRLAEEAAALAGSSARQLKAAG